MYGQYPPPMWGMPPPNIHDWKAQLKAWKEFEKELEKEGTKKEQKQARDVINKGMGLIHKSIVLTFLSIPLGMLASQYVILFARSWAMTMSDMFK